MARKKTLPQQRREQTRALILDAAYRVFARRGYEDATVEEITEECGIAKGALYYHFQSKEKLFQAVLEDHVRRRTKEVASRLEPGLPLRESILRIIKTSWSDCMADPYWSPLFTEFWAIAGRNEWGREAIASLFEHCSTALGRFLSDAQDRGLVRRDVDVLRAARLMLALNDGLILQWQAQPDKVKPDEFLQPMADMITRYLAAEEKKGRSRAGEKEDEGQS
jgi:AcrR family transcriptional regulator